MRKKNIPSAEQLRIIISEDLPKAVNWDKYTAGEQEIMMAACQAGAAYVLESFINGKFERMKNE